MADTILGEAGKQSLLLLHDNGDGTYSLQTYAASGSGGITEYAEDAAHGTGNKGIMALAVRKDTAAALAGTDGDYAPLEVDASGRLHVAPLVAGTATIGATMDAGPSWTSSYTHTASADASGTVLVTGAPTAGQKIVVDDIIVSTGAALTVTFEEETSGTDVMVLYMAANTVVQITPRGKIKLPTADKKLAVDTSGAGAIAVTVVYHSEA